MWHNNPIEFKVQYFSYQIFDKYGPLNRVEISLILKYDTISSKYDTYISASVLHWSTSP